MTDRSDVPSLDIAVLAPSLAKYGGAERYLLECVSRWQDHHRITLYATAFDETVLAEHGIAGHVARVRLTGYFEGEHASLLNATLLPAIWRREISRHDLYNPHLWPMHLIDLHPMVWLAHEPFRALHDLRYEQHISGGAGAAESVLHVYPKFNYDRLARSLHFNTLEAIQSADKAVRPDAIVANSRRTARNVEDIYGRPVDAVVYPGAEPDEFIELPRDPNLFVTIGQLWAHKRVKLLIEAIALTDETQLMVIGSGPERPRLETMAERLGVADRVFFLSGLTNRELSLVLGRASAFLFAAIREPFGIVVLEAMAAGKPVIATQDGGYAEVCTAQAAFLVPPFPAAFAEKMALVQRDEALAASMGEAGRRIAAKFTWRRTADEVESVLVKAWLQHGQPAQAPQSVETRGPLVGIHYYLWYGDGYGAEHWNDNPMHGHVADRPLLGYYPSYSGETISFHLDLFERMHLDFAALNLHFDDQGFDPREFAAIEHVFEIAATRAPRLKFAIQLAPYTDDLAMIERAVETVGRKYGTHPCHLQLAGAPALFWFWSSAHDGNAQVLHVMARAAARHVNLATALRLPDGRQENRHTFGFFGGFAPYSPLELAGPDTRSAVWRAAYEAADAAGMTWRMATVSPGYDDRALDDPRRTGNPFRVVPRNDGSTYRETMQFVEELQPLPDIVLISTFNELHENTHIEPTRANGELYVDMTRDFVLRLKGRRNGNGNGQK